MLKVGLIGCGHISETYFRSQTYFNNINILLFYGSVLDIIISSVIVLPLYSIYFKSTLNSRIIIPIIEAVIAPIRSYTFSTNTTGAVYVLGILKPVFRI